MLLRTVALVLVACSFAQAADFASLDQRFNAKESTRDRYPRFRLTNGDCYVNPAAAVSSRFNKARFEAEIEARSGNYVTAMFSAEGTNGRYEDETFHDTQISLGIGQHQPEQNNSVTELNRHFSVTEWEKRTYTEPRYTVAGYHIGSRQKTVDVEVKHDVRISHETRTVDHDGEQRLLLQAKGESSDYAWSSTVLYYCLFSKQ